MRHAAARLGSGAIVLVIEGIVLWALALLVDGVANPSLGAAILMAAVIAVINALVWPLLTRVTLRLTVLSFGLFSLVLNALVIHAGFRLIDGHPPNFWGALLVALGLAAASAAIQPLLDFEGDAYNLRAVRRRVRKARRANVTDVPGVIMFEIDGLGEGILREAIAGGNVPTIARWIADGSHRIVPWECDLSSQTGASQAGLLQGSNHDMPAFRWYEKESGKVIVSNHPRDAAEIERRRSNGAGLLAADGGSRGNLLSGDAVRCVATLSTVRDRSRARPDDLYAYFADPYGFLRTLVLVIHDVVLEKLASRRQRRSGAPRVHRGGIYPLARAATTVALRDLNVATLTADIVEGVPVAYATFVGYDEVAHHSGIREPDALAVLKRLDARLRRLERATSQAPRPYHLVVLSDHGQSQGAPFRQRHGTTLEELVASAMHECDLRAPPAVSEAWGELGGVLTEARQHPSFAGRALQRATRGAVVDDEVALGPERDARVAEAAVEQGGPAEVVVLASGNLGLVSFPRMEGRATLEQIEAAHPGLVQTLATHPGIGFVLVRSEAEGPVLLGTEGSRRLEDDHVDGRDPLTRFPETAADHLRRTDAFPHCPDLLINGAYDAEKDEVAPFEEFMGSHGGLGGRQSRPFALVPTEWPEPPEPIVGCEAMHRRFRGWLAGTGVAR